MDLNQVLDGHDKKEEIINFVKGEIEKASEKAGLESSRKANKEAQNIRERFKMPWSKLNLDPDNENFEDSIESLVEKLADLDDIKSGKKVDPEIKALKRQIDKLTESYQKAEQEKQDLKRSNFLGEVRTSLNKALTENEALDPDLADILFNRLDLSNDSSAIDEIRFKETGESIGEGVKAYIDAKPYFKKNNNLPGGGSNSNNGQSGTGSVKTNLTGEQKILAYHMSKQKR